MKTILAIQVILVLAVGIGWTRNFIKLVNCDFEPSYKAEVIHIAGLIPPIGMVTGWLDVGK